MNDSIRSASDGFTQSDPLSLPLIILRSTVVFPHTSATVTLGRKRSVNAFKHAQANDLPLIVVLEPPDAEEDPTAPGYSIGTLVDITSVGEPEEDSFPVTVTGRQRVRILDRSTALAGRNDEFWLAHAQILPEAGDLGAATTAAARHARALFHTFARISRKVGNDEPSRVEAASGVGELADLIASFMPISAELKQSVLEVLDPVARLEHVSVQVATEIEIQELEAKIRQRVRGQVDKNQREYYLKEQLRAIQEELGNDLTSEMNELRKRLDESGMPEEVAQKVGREIDRLERMPSHSAEVTVLRGYLDWALALPWAKRSNEHLDIGDAQKVLDADHYGLADVKDRILEFLAVRQLRARRAHGGEPIVRDITATRQTERAAILCLVGAPGVGKTSLGRSVARALGREFVRISLGGVHDEAEMRGHRRTYVGALPGKIVQGLRTAGTKNPVVLLDEVDKMTSDYRGDPAAALLEILDPEQNHTFTDHYMEVPFDLSDVFFICTANDRWSIPGPLRDRMDVIEVPSYTEEEKVEIGLRHLLPRVRAEHALREDQLVIDRTIMAFIISRYTREAGVRGLDRQLSTLARKVARKALESPHSLRRLTEKSVERYLGIPIFSADRLPESDAVGVVNGMAWTSYGGTLLSVEVLTMPGQGHTQVTGKLGDVMQESARAAISWIRAHAAELHIPPQFPHEMDIHVHLPEGAVPKDGPSAGVTMALAIVSALTGRPARHDTAMTGEITLTGRILPVGGIREKVLAAKRANVRIMIA
ncbi:MAG TPA: endopeptidase La, partial [Ktedonobacterales bacterium]